MSGFEALVNGQVFPGGHEVDQAAREGATALTPPAKP